MSTVSKQLERLARVLSPAVGAVALCLTSACLSTNGDAKNAPPRPQSTLEGMPEAEAIEVAKKHAAMHGYDPDVYEMRTQKEKDIWWVHFERREKLPILGGDNHFSIRIQGREQVRFFGGM